MPKNIGYEYQDIIRHEIDLSSIVRKTILTKGSGSKHGDGDIIVEFNNGFRIAIDTKYKEKYKHSNEMKKIMKQSKKRCGYNGIGILIRGNSPYESKVEMDFLDFISMLEAIHNNK